MPPSPFQRYAHNPILQASHLQSEHPLLEDASSVFNPGGLLWREKTLLLLRVQSRSRETFIVRAQSDNGVDFDLDTTPTDLVGSFEKPFHAYDPRMTLIDGKIAVFFAADFHEGCRIGLAFSQDGKTFEPQGYTQGSYPDTRNAVLFPEKIQGRYLRLERPNLLSSAQNPSSGDSITLSLSEDLIHWEHEAKVFSGRWRYWDERIGAGPPPIKTTQGWLLLYHGVATHFASSHIYQMGAALLDLNDPSKLLARSRLNILEPRTSYELTGQVPNVVFGSAATVETDSQGYAQAQGLLKLYYGAADTSIGLAQASINSLIQSLDAPDTLEK